MNEKSEIRLGESEYRFACIVWEREPVASGELVRLAAAQLGWKKSTTYTVLKNLREKGILQNQDGIVTALVSREQARRAECAAVVDKAFEGSLPQFVAAFLGHKAISAQEAAEIEALLERYKEVQ